MAKKENQKCFAIVDTNDDFWSPKKKKCCQKKSASERFWSKTGEVEIAVITKGYRPANTKRSKNWA